MKAELKPDKGLDAQHRGGGFQLLHASSESEIGFSINKAHPAVAHANAVGTCMLVGLAITAKDGLSLPSASDRSE